MIKREDIDRLYDILKVGARGQDFSHTELIEFASKMANVALPGVKISPNIIDSIVERYEENVSIKSYAPDVLVDFENDPEWFYKLKADENQKHDFFKRYKDFLRNNDFAEDSIDRIESNSEKILSYCANPFNSTDIKARKKKGLVVGDVQSGKTANYLALINMASDYGYSVIVVLAGMTESLRKQTQGRIDEGYIGALSNTIGSEEIKYIGVGAQERTKNHYAIPLTNLDYDFSTKVKTSINSTRGDYNKPQILVVKKNKKTLENVRDWIKPGQNNIQGNSILIIDDEADNASVNTKKKDDPSIINGLIRDIFNNFTIASYVGYTATPYANIFINPDDEQKNLDLFPSDFIIQLNSPTNYFGGSKVFEGGENKVKYKYLRIIDEQEGNFLDVYHKKDDKYNGLSESLKESIRVFLLNNVLRTLKGGKQVKKHRTMMINISRFNDMQKNIKYHVEEYVEKLKNIIEQTCYMNVEKFVRNQEMKALYDLYNSDEYYVEFKNKHSWSKIQELLFDEVSKFNVVIINNRVKNEDRFNYEDYEETGARVITIGGFVLSRGLTLEGLMVSYFSRSGSAYDTMLQMCRWFGYRPGYEDLCRIYMSKISLLNFNTVIDATEDLKSQFREMSAQGKTPKNFGLMVKESPDILETTSMITKTRHKMLVTSRNKYGTSQEVVLTLNYSATPIDTSKLYKSKDANNNNKRAIDNFIKTIKSQGIILEVVNGRHIFQNVNNGDIAALIRELNLPLENRKFDRDSLVDYISKTDKFDKWDVVIAKGSSESHKMQISNYSIPAAKRSFEVRKNENYIRISGSNNRLLEPGIFNSGLTKEQIEQIKKDRKTPIAKDYLGVSGRKPLFIIYPVELFERGEVNGEEKQRILQEYSNEIIYGFGIGFPGKDDEVKIKMRANQRKIEELTKHIEEDEDDDAED